MAKQVAAAAKTSRSRQSRVTRADALEPEARERLARRLAELERAREAAERSSRNAYVGVPRHG